MSLIPRFGKKNDSGFTKSSHSKLFFSTGTTSRNSTQNNLLKLVD